LPNSLIEIWSGAFWGCTSLTSINIPNGTRVLSNRAFLNCTSLKSIELPDTLEFIYEETFSNCTSLEFIIIPSSVKHIVNLAFENCCNLIILCESSYKPKDWDTNWNSNCPYVWGYQENVKSDDSFEYVLGNGEAYIIGIKDEVNDVVIPSTIGGYTVAGFTGRAITKASCYINKTITSLSVSQEKNFIYFEDTFDFSGCTSLTSFSFESDYQGKFNFTGCTSLVETLLPDDCTFTYRGCSSLVNAYIPKNTMSIEYEAFKNCASLMEIILPDCVASIGAAAFSGCSSLSNIVLPNGLEEIGRSAFNYCTSLESIIIPKTVTTVHTSSFVWYPHEYDCEYCPFYGCVNLTIYLEKGIDKTNWGDFWSVVHIEFHPADTPTYATVVEDYVL